MKKRTYSIGKAAIIRCLSVAAILTVAVFSGCTPDSPENPENPREELDEGNIKINVSGGGELGDYTTKAAASREARYTVTGRVISGNGAGIEDETFEVVVTPNEGPTGFMPATRASYGAVQVDGTKKTATIRWDEGDRVSVFSDVGKHDNTYAHPGTGNVNNIAYCNYDIKEEQTAQGYTATATPVAAAPFNGSGLKWDTGKAHRFIGIWPPVDTIATLADAKIEADRLELSFNVKQPSKQTAKLDANISNESVYRPDLGSVMMYSGLSVAADKAVESTDVDLLFRPAFTSLEFALLKQDDTKTMTLQYVTVSSQENFLACQSDQKFTGVISQDANASGNNGTTFTIDATSLSQTGSKSIDLTFLDASGADLTPELDFTKPTKFCILALPHQIGTLTIFLGLKVGGEEVVRQLDLRVNQNGFKKWIEIPACSKVIISNLRIPTSVTKGLVQKEFSVAPNKTVYFSPGNLQAKLNGQGGAAQWRFAPNQYDIVAKYKADDNSNTNVTSGEGWVDLFGWSGKDNEDWTTHGLRMPNPNLGVLNNEDYFGRYEHKLDNELAALTANNYIWTLLTKYEIDYLLNQRTDAAAKAALATVGNVEGIVILPDDWSLPINCTFESAPLSSGNYTTNKYSTAGFPGTSGSWTAMEKEGAVFFPNTGFIDPENNYDYDATRTYYQTYSDDDIQKRSERISSYGWSWDGISQQDYASGRPVRLATLAPEEGRRFEYQGNDVTPSGYEFSVGNGSTVRFTTSNLMWEGGNNGKGRFKLMPNPWSYVETLADNVATVTDKGVSDNTGLFPWGANGWNGIWPWTKIENGNRAQLGMTLYSTRPPINWRSDRVVGNFWDWGDNVVYDSEGNQMSAERSNSTLRTLTSDEWAYLLDKRSGLRYAPVIIINVDGDVDGDNSANDNVAGILIFPDGYENGTGGVTFSGSRYNQKPMTRATTFTTTSYHTKIDASTFDKLRAKGVVFLPCAGVLFPAGHTSNTGGNTSVKFCTGGTGAKSCYYWSSSLASAEAEKATYWTSGTNFDGFKATDYKDLRMAVRLVYTYSPSALEAIIDTGFE